MADHSRHASDGAAHGFSAAGLAGHMGAEWSLCWGSSFFFFFFLVCFHESMSTCKDDRMLPVISDGCILTLVCSVFRYIGYLPFDYLAAQTLNTKVFYIFKLCDTGFFVNI